MRLLLLSALLLSPLHASAQGLKGAPGGLLKPVDPKVTQFELQVLEALNAARKKAKMTNLSLDEKLRTFARREAELAATGSPEHKSFEVRLKQQIFAPHGHRMQFGYSSKAMEAAAALLKDPTLKTTLVDETTTRVGIGGFYVPETPPYFQYALLVVSDPDPMAGRPGLSAADTAAVMERATPAIKACYDQALARDPNAKGDAIFQIIIGGDGKVESVKLLRSIGDPAFDACALLTVKGLVFKAPYRGKPVTLNHPMRFTPPQGNQRVGRLSKTQVQSAFGVASADLKACYDASAKTKPTLAGTLTLGLSVSELGAITALDVVHDELNDAALTACVLERIKQVRFPVPEFAAPLTLTYPLRFAPGGTGAP